MAKQNALEDAGMTSFHWWMALFGSGGWFIDGYILTSIAVALTQITPELGLSASQAGAVGSIALVGILVGALIGGPVSDHYGRRKILTLDLLVFLVANVLQFFVGGVVSLLVLRFLLGVAIGLDYAVAAPYMAELSPRRQRGPLLAVVPTAWFVGAVVAYVATYLMLGLGEGAWRWMLASGAVPSLIVLALRATAPESPRWLLAQGRVDEAKQVIEQVFGKDATVEDISEEMHEKPGGLMDLARSRYVGRTLFFGFFWMFQVAPLFAIYTFAPEILSKLGMGEGYIGSIVLSVLFVIFAIPSTLVLLNKWGRRPLAIWSFVLATAAFLVLAIPGLSLALTVAAFTVYALGIGSAQVLEGVYAGELFPTGIRSTAAGVGAAISRVGSAASTFLFPIALAAWGTGPVMIGMAVLSAAGAAICIAWAPETKGKTLVEAAGQA